MPIDRAPLRSLTDHERTTYTRHHEVLDAAIGELLGPV
jgi:hypothetical protein